MFRFFVQDNPFRQMTKGAAKVSFFTGLLLIGLGLLVWLLKDIMAIVLMILFFMAGFSAIGWSIRLFIAQWKMRKDTGVYRKGVEVHFEEKQ